MEVILLDFVKHLGDKNDVVKVKPGYANNFLIPNRLALPATPSNLKVLRENTRQAEHRRAQLVEAARKLAEQLEGLSLRIEALVGQDDRIYGSVTTLQLANEFKMHGFEVDRRKIFILDDVKTLGQYNAEVVLEKGVKAVIKFDVVGKVS